MFRFRFFLTCGVNAKYLEMVFKFNIVFKFDTLYDLVGSEIMMWFLRQVIFCSLCSKVIMLHREVLAIYRM